MTNPNNLDAAHARIESLERETRELAEQNARMNARLVAPQPKRVVSAPPPEPRAPKAKTSSADDEPALGPYVTILVIFIAAVVAMLTTKGHV